MILFDWDCYIFLWDQLIEMAMSQLYHDNEENFLIVNSLQYQMQEENQCKKNSSYTQVFTK